MTDRDLASALGLLTEFERGTRAALQSTDTDEAHAAQEAGRRVTALRLATERWLLQRATRAALTEEQNIGR